MNRHQRRQAASRSNDKDAKSSVPEELFFSDAAKPSVTVTPPQAAKPALLVRLVAAIVLSNPIRRRVHNPAVRSLLAVIAREVGRLDLAAELEK